MPWWSQSQPPLPRPAAPAALAAAARACPQQRCRPPALDVRRHLPWEPLLTDEEVQRGEGYYGTGRRLRRVASKLLAGEPIQVRSGRECRGGLG